MSARFFSSSGDAYDACQCQPDIATGDTLVCHENGSLVVGVADTWPIAVTALPGALHSVADWPATVTAVGRPGIVAAVRIAVGLGLEIDDGVWAVIQTGDLEGA